MNQDKRLRKVRVNQYIKSPSVRLIDHDGSQVGVVDLKDALQRAYEASLDLVEIAPEAKPPVCRVMDYGKYLYEQSKKHKKKSKQITTKEIKFRPNTEVGDYTIKVRKMLGFLQNGDKVKVTVRFRGREIAYQNLGVDIMHRVEADLAEFGSVEQSPKLEGRQLVMVLGPKRK